MSTLTDHVREQTDLDRDQIAHLNRLVSEWGILADFSFSDLLLYVETRDGAWLTVGQVRPATGQTIFATDFVGVTANGTEAPLLAAAQATGAITEGEVEVEDMADPSRMMAIPVRHEGQVIAVMTKEWVDLSGRRPGELERVYTEIFDHFVDMIVDGEFPFSARVGESVRRIRTIALVHEALSREPGDDVTFLEIVRPLLRLAEEGLQSPDRPVQFTVEGDGGRIPATIATPLSVVLTELLQNAVEHAFGEGSGGGSVVVGLAHDDDHLTITVVDDGRGVARGFDLEQATGLGLSIVRTLVTTELAGTIEMMPASVDDLASAGLDTGGTAHGTVVRLRVPTSEE